MKGRKIERLIKSIVSSVILLSAVLFVLNMILTNRLERFLKKELVERTSKATDGFYKLSFDDLSISFFKGELKISGVSFTPDPATFHLWESKDSLPDIYINAKVGTIGFRGVNLTWRWNFKRLHFQSFEIKSPEIHLFSPFYANHTAAEIKHSKSKTLYEIISPYINVLSVRTLNLENASIFYTVQNSSTPIIYALNNVSFHGYGFWLDSLSSTNGKLLYCDNFDFKTNRPQTLLTNNDFLLQTDSIALDTQDSIIYIKDIRILPQEKLWNERKQKPDNFLSANIHDIEAKGVFFKRKHALNYLEAHSFNISNPDIEAFNLVNEKSGSNKDSTDIAKTDSIVQALSLYDIISPVLHSVSIHQVSVNDAHLNYSQSKHQFKDIYQVDNFSFRGNEFLIDSLSFEKYDLGYFRSFSFNASGINGMMPTHNYHFQIENMMLNTETKHFQINKVKLNPISTNTHKDYISGQIDSVGLNGLFYKKGTNLSILNMGKLTIVRPQLTFKWYQKKKILPTQSGKAQFNIKNIYKQLGSFTNQVVLDKIKITEGRFEYINIVNDSTKTDEIISPFDLELTGVDIDNIKQKCNLKDIYFQTKDIKIPLDNGFYFLNIGTLKLKQSQLILDSLHLVSPYPKMEFAYKQPQHKDWFDVKIGNISLTDIDIPHYFTHNQLKIGNLQIKDVLLQNFKNKKIYVEPHIVPMVYSFIQKAPVLFTIGNADIKNFSVIYEELEKKGTLPGKIYFTDMNGHFSGLTNIISSNNQYIRLDANGKLMGQGYFAAIWELPVDSLNDRFLLHAQMDSLNLTALNEIITPLVSAEIKSGWTNGFSFNMDASSKGGEIELQFPYRNLKVSLQKEKNGEIHNNTFLSGLANLLLRDNNPSHPEKADSKLRYINMYIERDPYHSTFNYLWQLLRPAVAASVGVSKTEQDVAKGISSFFGKVKRFFEGEKKKFEEHEEKREHK